MPWEIAIKRPDGGSLGSQREVRTSIEAAFPGVRFFREPSGPEKLESLPPGTVLPDVIREHWARQQASMQGDFEAEGYSLRFYLGAVDSKALDSVDVEARGASRPAMPFFDALTLATGWIVVDNWNRVIVENGRTVPEAR
jgi:hypothetical protein